MKKLLALLVLVVLVLNSSINAQMEINGELRYGNEWIDYSQTYYRIVVSEDGVYKIGAADLEAAGLNINQIAGNNLALYNRGEQVPIYVSSTESFSDSDYIVFEGKRNDGALDRHLYLDPDNMQLHSEFSLFTDESVYYLSLIDGGQKVQDVNNIDTGISPEAYYIHEQYLNLAENPIKPTYNGSDKVRYSDFDIIEGFGSRMQRTTTAEIPTSNIYNSVNINAEVEIRFGSNTVEHHAQLSLNSMSNIIYEEEYSGYTVKHWNIPFSANELSNNTSISLLGLNESDNHSIAFIRLKYPRAFVFSETDYLSFSARAGQTNRYYNFESISSTNEAIHYFDFSLGVKKTLIPSGGNIDFEVNNISQDKLIHLLTEDGYKSPKSVSEKNFIDFKEINPEYLIVTSNALRSESYGGKQMVDEYANYRSSDQGGGYNVEIVEIDELYDQFIYGIDHHPSSCQNFINYLESDWTDLQFIFIIGKAVEYSDYRFEEDLNSELIPTLHVPTWGLPGSDNLLFGKRNFQAALAPVGRIAARTAEDIDAYYQKVLSHETINERAHTVEERQWTKKIMHLSGGDPDIQNAIFGWLGDMSEIIEQDSFGGEVITFRKSSTDLLQDADSEKILNTINDGVSIITFFGHSAVGTFDFSLEKASEYSNKDKYPMLISLGCHSGNIHAGSSGRGLSEDFVFEKEKGAIAFLASSSTAYIGPQYVTGRTFYENISQDFYGNSIGNALQHYLKENETNISIAVRTLVQQMTYHGDPAIRFYSSDAPDYLVDVSSVQQTPAVITSSDENFNFEFDIINIGTSITDSISISIQHFLPDETLFHERTIRIPTPKFKQSIDLEFENPGIAGLGKNYLEVFVDSGMEIQERPNPDAEDNNHLSFLTTDRGYEFFIESNVARPVSPSEFAIINEPTVSLIASTTNVFSEETEYIIQIDTSELFTAPLEQTILTRSGGKIQWEPSIQLQEEIVYYWRVSPNNEQAEKIWYSSSFTYIPNVGEGWNQGHYYQFLKDEFDGLDLPGHDQMQFDTNGFFITITNKLFDPVNPPCYQFNFGQCASSVRPWNFMVDGGIAFVLGDPVSGSGQINQQGLYNSIPNSSEAAKRVFGFYTNTPEERKKVIDFLDDIPDLSYVWAMTIMHDSESDIKIDEWRADTLLYGTSILHKLEEQGAGLTDELEINGDVPYNFIFRKNFEVYGEDVGTTFADEVVTNVFIPIKDTQGTLTSTLIGPARSWSYLSWDLENIENVDSASLAVYGIDAQGKTTLFDVYDTIGDFDLSEISASLYPYMRLELYSEDRTNRTAPNLKHLRVYYRKPPEAIYNTDENFVFNSDTLNQGQFLNFRANVENITGVDMSELLVHYKIIDEENNEIFNAKIDEPISAFGNINIDFNYSTDQLVGDYLFVVEFNPDFEQAEQFIFNNIGIRQFHVRRNQLNPILDVQFDQTRIRDGDIVSPNPVIDIRLYDNNEFLLNADPNNFQQAIIFEDGSRIDYDVPSANLEHFPGTLDNNNVPMMRLRPNRLDQGTYTLVAQAKDATGSFSGKFAYEVDFRVVSNSCVPSFFNYPNPFNETTTFEYSLTGTNLPESIDIDIYDGRGQIVRRIRDEELNTYGIGNNRILYTWDGKSENGSQLANGVYYYRLILNGLTNNQSFKNCGELEAQLGGKLIIMN